MKKSKTAGQLDAGSALRQFQFIHASKASDIPALCELEQSEFTPVRHAACKKRHALENYEILRKANPLAHISKGKNDAGHNSRARTGETRRFQRF